MNDGAPNQSNANPLRGSGTKAPVRTGLDVLAAEGFARLTGHRIGVLANAASVSTSLEHLVDLLAARKDCRLVRIFAPEHGFRGAAQDMVSVDSTADPKTGLPVISLYGSTFESLAPREEPFQGIDLLLVDLPDIGTRYYTFAQSMALCMQVAARCDVKVMVLDRPNPINGNEIEGAPLLKKCRSFCGLLPAANRHGLTLGELAFAYQSGLGRGEDAWPPIGCRLEVVKCENWKRRMYFNETGLPWVQPSPNMPTLDTALVYPGSCLFETTNLSEGRGTTRPFETLGAPFVDSQAWIEAVQRESLELAGASLRPVSFIPQFHKWQGQSCQGVQIHVIDRKAFKPLRWGLALLAAARRLYPDRFQWRENAYEFVSDVPAVDLLYGNPLFRETLEKGDDLSAVGLQLAAFEKAYRRARAKFLLY